MPGHPLQADAVTIALGRLIDERLEQLSMLALIFYLLHDLRPVVCVLPLKVLCH